MPYEMPLGEIITIILTGIGVVAAQAFALWKWLDSRFRGLENAIDEQVKEGRLEMAEHVDSENARAAALTAEISRVDRDVATLREKVSSLPTRDQLDDMFDRKMDKLERKFDRLYAALVRFVPPNGTSRIFPDDGN